MHKQVFAIVVLILWTSPLCMPAQSGLKTALFAGGCFWCIEAPFDNIDGVISTTSGYTGGDEKNPTYEQVSSGGTGHAEAIRIVYDPGKVDYGKLLQVFWHNIDPVAVNRQFCDKGKQYRSAIFYHDEQQRLLAETSRAELEATRFFKKKIATQIEPAGEFWPAEEYHQDYYRKKPLLYKFYRFSCGRDKRLEEIWEDLAGK